MVFKGDGKKPCLIPGFCISNESFFTIDENLECPLALKLAPSRSYLLVLYFDATSKLLGAAMIFLVLKLVLPSISFDYSF